MNLPQSPPTFYGVGVGPGDPELITVKALNVLKRVDKIFCPSADPQLDGFARSILVAYELPDEKFCQVTVNMARDRSAAHEDYRLAAQEISANLANGRSVAWITEGDPLLYSTFLYVAEAVRLQAPDVPQRIVPGITSIQAAAAAADFPLTSLSESMTIIPAAYGVGQLAQLMQNHSSIALLKIRSVFDRLLDEIAPFHDEVEAVYAERVGTPQQRIVTALETLRGQKLPYFSLVLLRRKSEAVA